MSHEDLDERLTALEKLVGSFFATLLGFELEDSQPEELPKLRDAELLLIKEAMRRCNENSERAARLLDIPVHVLRYKIKQLEQLGIKIRTIKSGRKVTIDYVPRKKKIV